MDIYKGTKRTHSNLYIYLGLITLNIIIYVLTLIASDSPEWIESNYTHFLYIFIFQVVSFLTSLVPFSLTEFIVVFTILFLIYWLIKNIIDIKRKKIIYKKFFIKLFSIFLIIFTIFFTGFYCLWGFNYFRIQLDQKYNFDKSKITQDRLRALLYYSIYKTNYYYSPKYIFNSKESNKLIDNEIIKVYQLFNDTKQLYSLPESKTIFFNIYLNLLQVSGFTSPLQEAHYNSSLTSPELPFTIAHEKAHILGYTSEAEANFIAYLVCTKANNDYLIYSGYFETMLRLLNNSSLRDDYKVAYSMIRKEVKDEIQVIRERVKKYETFMSQFAWKVYDSYLKVNKVQQGVKDYGRVINFILAYEKIPPVVIKE